MTHGASRTTSSTQRQLRTDSQLGVDMSKVWVRGRTYIPLGMRHCGAGFVGVNEFVRAYADHEINGLKGKLGLPEL